MTGGRARRILTIAFAVSILVHLLGVRFVHWSIPNAVDIPDTTKVSHITLAHLPRHTPAPQTPKPVPTATTVAQRVKITPIHVPQVRPHAGLGATIPTIPVRVATPSPTPTPFRLTTPVPVASGGCATPNAPAAVKSSPAPPDVPAAVRQAAKSGLAQIRVRLTEQGGFVDEAVESSSGDGGLDQIALQLAKEANYTPALAQCKGTASTYLYRVKFVTP